MDNIITALSFPTHISNPLIHVIGAVQKPEIVERLQTLSLGFPISRSVILPGVTSNSYHIIVNNWSNRVCYNLPPPAR